MQQLFKKLTFITLSMMSVSVYGMEQEQNTVVSFARAFNETSRGKGIGLLQQFFQAGKGLNDLDKLQKLYPLVFVIEGRYASSLIVTAICNGARVDLQDGRRRTLFHYFAMSPRFQFAFDKDFAYFPKQNLLSAFALPTHQYAGDNVLSEKEKHAREEKFKALRKSIKTFLLCVNKPEWQGLKAVRYILLAHMQGETAQDGIYCQEMFHRVVEHVTDFERLVAQSPFEWFKAVVLSRPCQERGKFISKFAPLIARYRLQQALHVLIKKNDEYHSPFNEATKTTDQLRAIGYEKEVIESAQQVADMLELKGFVERNMPDCTKIVANVLESKDPFFGFEFK